MHKHLGLDDRPVWWLVCDGGPRHPHKETLLGGVASAWNDPWPTRQSDHHVLAARVLGNRFEPEEPLASSGGLWAVTVHENRRWKEEERDDWRTRHHVRIVGDWLVAACPTCGRHAKFPTARLVVEGPTLQLDGDNLLPSGMTASMRRLDR